MSKEEKRATYYIIEFGPTDKAMDGSTLEEAAHKEIMRMELRVRQAGQTLSEENIEFIKSNILSKRDAEKDILQSLLIQSRKTDAKGLARFNKICDLAAAIDDAECTFEVESEELEVLRKAFEEKLKDTKEPMPAWWGNCRELFKQLENPKKKEESKQEVSTPVA